jgi:hypothetical protein
MIIVIIIIIIILHSLFLASSTSAIGANCRYRNQYPIIITTVRACFIKLLSRMFLDPNTLTSLQIILSADAHLAEGQFLLEEQTLNNANSLIYRTGTPCAARKDNINTDM